MEISLHDGLTKLKGVGDKKAELYRKLEIDTVNDLLNHLPRRYEDYSKVSSISDLRPGKVSVKGTITSINDRYVRRGLHITEAVMTDESGSLKIVWFNQPYRKNATKKDETYYASGEFQFQNRRYVLSNPSLELVGSENRSTARILPIYPETSGLKSHQIRKDMLAAKTVIKKIQNILPKDIIDRIPIKDRSEAILKSHFPKTTSDLEAANAYFAFEELMILISAAQITKNKNSHQKSHKVPFVADVAKSMVKKLPFELTDSQRKAAWECLSDIQKDYPMNRLVEGDVGSGKTVVAALVINQTLNAGYQAGYLAPTTLLAAQQYSSLKNLIPNARIELLQSKTNKKEAARIAKELNEGNIDLIVGTHALLEDNIQFKNMALCVIDEQHRFGVSQREALISKSGGLAPHLLTMTATPIPRTLALTIYGDLDISVMTQKPINRKEIITKLVQPNSRSDMYEEVIAQLRDKKQAFVVFPVIDESVLGLNDLNSGYEKLKKSIFKDFNVELLHGRMKADDKERVMKSFAAGNIDVLVSTTVVEVGVDVPNATVMIIESAERYGLAQLHQLRGRVGRSQDQAYCYLVPTISSAPTKRLREMTLTSDGFKLAEADLKIRGPGEIYGYRQHGGLDLRKVDTNDVKMLANAKVSAQKLLEKDKDLIQYPLLKQRVAEVLQVTRLN